MTHRGALIASFALTIAVALVLGTQWDLITTRGSQADPTATPSAPAEEFIDPNTSDPTDSTGGPGVAAQSGLSLGTLNDTSSTPQSTSSAPDTRGSWDDEDDHEDNEDYEHDEHDD
ncbi:MAG TPA: hypothetical protein VEQ36_04880 [Thermomicrobiales bacterium]|nr:hypothetical protein [Thermomicrobiales bacterium]